MAADDVDATLAMAVVVRTRLDPRCHRHEAHPQLLSPGCVAGNAGLAVHAGRLHRLAAALVAPYNPQFAHHMPRNSVTLP